MADGADGWRVVEATFEKSAPDATGCPPPDLPEVAIGGRSNVGKSSLINALCNTKGLARVSRTPGRTQLLNSFRVRLAGPRGAKREFRCMDLPGYGYAAARRDVRAGFAPLIESYLAAPRGLVALVLLVDLRRGFSDHDLAVVQDLSERQVSTLVVATKVDKLTASARGIARAKMAAAVGIQARDVVMTSATRREGLWGSQSLAADLADLVAQPRTDSTEAS